MDHIEPLFGGFEGTIIEFRDTDVKFDGLSGGGHSGRRWDNQWRRWGQEREDWLDRDWGGRRQGRYSRNSKTCQELI